VNRQLESSRGRAARARRASREEPERGLPVVRVQRIHRGAGVPRWRGRAPVRAARMRRTSQCHVGVARQWYSCVRAGESPRTRRAQATDEPVFLHPRSALARAAPEFVAYAQLVRGPKRPYLAGAARVACMRRLTSGVHHACRLCDSVSPWPCARWSSSRAWRSSSVRHKETPQNC